MTRAKSLKLEVGLKIRGFGINISHSAGLNMREKEGEKKNLSLFRRSTKFRRSEFVKPKTKVHRLDKGYAWVQKKIRDFSEDP